MKVTKHICGYVIVHERNVEDTYPYRIYTNDEYEEYGLEMGIPEWECDSFNECLEWIDDIVCEVVL